LNTKIKRFKEINEFFETTGFHKRTDIPEFFIFSFEELNKDSAVKMPPYQKDFYQISLIIQSEDSSFSINQQQSSSQKNILYFLSPDHIFSWKRDIVTQGYICYFKTNFLGFFKGNIETDFSFFNLIEQNIVVLDDQQAQEINLDFKKLHTEYYIPNSYRTQILQSSLLSLLFKCKSLNDVQNKNEIKPSEKLKLVNQFKNLVNNCYITDKQVNIYAEKLSVRAAYLNDSVKEITGKNAKDLISERIMDEAKKLLHYSTDDVAQIAYALGFEEPTNFIRFFKTHSQTTPKDFRNQLLLPRMHE
jgi:AraC family transcriptional regulator, transcriptional activator of pobA